MPSTLHDAFLLTKADVDALCAFASSDPRRDDLNQVVFDVSNGRIHATDGYTLVRVTVSRPELSARSAPPRFGVPRRTLRACARSLKASQQLSVCFADNRIDIGVADSAASAPVLVTESVAFDPEFVFPDHEHAIPEHCYERRGASSAFNGEFLARLALMQRACGASGLDFFAPTAPLAGSVFEATSGEASWLAVVMPFRSERVDALSRRWSQTAPRDDLSALANRKLSVALFRRIVERLAILGVAELTCFEQMLTTFASNKPDSSSCIAESDCQRGLT